MKNVLRDKSYKFALEIVVITKALQERNEFVLSRQLMRSGTSIGANIRESEYAQSKKDFINKLSVALKEANESAYWLDLLKDSNYITDEKHQNLISQNNELIAMLISSIKTTKSRLKIE
ncbi:four helix bundle protein [Profundicola chukchiensis]|uniref:four helix bundle protein n=1 Tax=Profundicola chukchiensis TaxID=2961959 RepID=UPI0034E246DD